MPLILILIFSLTVTAHSAENQQQSTQDAGQFAEELASRLQKLSETSPNGKITNDALIRTARLLLKKFGNPAETIDTATDDEILRLVREHTQSTLGNTRFLGEAGTDENITKALHNQYLRLLDGHRESSTTASKSTVTLHSAGQKLPLIHGCVIKPGWILTKASEAAKAKKLQVLTAPNTYHTATIVREWKDHDLALVKTETTDTPPLTWSTAPLPPLGSFLSVAGPLGADPIALGVVSVAPRSLITEGKGFLGVGLKTHQSGISITTLAPDGAAAKAGLQPNDIITSLNGNKIDSVANFARTISDLNAGDKVKITILRNNKPQEFEVSLGDRGKSPKDTEGHFDWMNSLGSMLSDRRDGFPKIFQSDFPLNSNECGAPVTDLEGNILGIVIARAGRVDTYVIPSDTIRKILSDVDWEHPKNTPNPPPIAQTKPTPAEKSPPATKIEKNTDNNPETTQTKPNQTPLRNLLKQSIKQNKKTLQKIEQLEQQISEFLKNK